MPASSSKPPATAPWRRRLRVAGTLALMLAAGWMVEPASAAESAKMVLPPALRPVTEKTIAMLDFELIDETLETAKDDAQKARLQQISEQLRAAFTENHLYRVVDNAPAAALITDLSSRFALHDCNGCDVDIGKALKTDRVLTAWVQKVSNLILNINIQIRDVKTGLIMLNKSVDIRSNTDDSWRRGIRYMVRSMVEKNQANL